MSEPFSPSFLEDVSKKAILEAGKIAISLKNSITVRYKSENQPVTNVDVRIDNYLKSFFKKKTPTYGWISEESSDDGSRFSSEFFWCVDPIDGTRSYINKKPEYTISLALIKKNKPVMGLVLNPETKELFFALKNKGAFCNEKKIQVNKKTTKKIKKISKSGESENIHIEEIADSQDKSIKQSNENEEVVILEKEDEIVFSDEVNNARKKRRRSSANIE